MKNWWKLLYNWLIKRSVKSASAHSCTRTIASTPSFPLFSGKKHADKSNTSLPDIWSFPLSKNYVIVIETISVNKMVHNYYRILRLAGTKTGKAVTKSMILNVCSERREIAWKQSRAKHFFCDDWHGEEKHMQ